MYLPVLSEALKAGRTSSGSTPRILQAQSLSSDIQNAVALHGRARAVLAACVHAASDSHSRARQDAIIVRAGASESRCAPLQSSCLPHRSRTPSVYFEPELMSHRA